MLCLLLTGWKLFRWFNLHDQVAIGDLHPRWLGLRLLLTEGANPYSQEVTEAIQRQMYGRLALPNKNQIAFAYPLPVMVIFHLIRWHNRSIPSSGPVENYDTVPSPLGNWLLPACLVLIPILLLFLISQVRPVYIIRAQLPSALAYYTLLGLVLFGRAIDEYRAAGYPDHPHRIWMQQRYTLVSVTRFGDLSVYEYEAGLAPAARSPGGYL